MNEEPPRLSAFGRVFAALWSVVRVIVFVLGVVLLLVVVLSYAAFRHLETDHAKALPARFALKLDLTRAPADAPTEPAWLSFDRKPTPNLVDTIRAIDRAGHDGQITKLDIVLGGDCCSLTTAEELHNAIARFRADSGKQVVARAMSFDGISGLGAYMVASAANHVELSAAGDFGITGIAVETPFAAGLLGKIGVVAQFEHIGAYKTYPQMYTRSSPSKANTEMLNSLVGSLYNAALTPVAARIGKSLDQVKALIDQAPLSADQAKQDGLVTDVLPIDRRIDHFGGDSASLEHYIAAAPAAPPHATKVALIIATGEIKGPFAATDARSIAPRHLAGEIGAALDDDSIKAIVLRLDTPGGTVTGSALVGAEVARAAAMHKPLIITMGALDASGGYWISSHGAALVADPATITGSIGVLGGKLTFGPLLDKIGLVLTGASQGANALYDSPVTPWTKPQLANLQGMLNLDYQQFVGWVAAGRHMSAAQVNAVGQGREWTGAQAKKRGLVDELGGYHTAFAVVRAKLKLPVHAPLDIIDGNAAPGLHTIIARIFAKANPLAAADLPPQFRALMALSHLHRLSMSPLILH